MIATSKRVRIGMLIIVLVMVLGGGGIYYNFNAAPGFGTDPAHDKHGRNVIGGHLAPIPTFENLVTHSDVVAQARVTAWETELVPCCSSIAARLPEGRPAPVRRWDTVTFEVNNTLKGTTEPLIKVKTQMPGGNISRSSDEALELMQFEVGQDYLLFLVSRDGHYLVQGVEKGRWTVSGDSMTQTGTGLTHSRAEIAQKVTDLLD